jgi:hypothetical protein
MLHEIKISQGSQNVIAKTPHLMRGTKQSHKRQDCRALQARNDRVNTIASFALVEEFRDRQSTIVNQQSQIS